MYLYHYLFVRLFSILNWWYLSLIYLCIYIFFYSVFYWIIFIYLLYYLFISCVDLARSYFLICVFCFRQVTLLIYFYCNGPTHWSEVSHIGLKRLSVSAGSSLSSASSRRTLSTTRWAAASASPTTDELWPLDIQRENYRSDLGTEVDFAPQHVKRFDIFPNATCFVKLN